MSNKRVIAKHLSWLFSRNCISGEPINTSYWEKVLPLEECQQVKVDEIAELENPYLAVLNETK